MISYEWIVEELEGKEEDVVDIDTFNRLAPALKFADTLRQEGKQVDVGLVRNVWDNFDGDLEDRQWAYLKDGQLPALFDRGARVPQRFLKEAKK